MLLVGAGWQAGGLLLAQPCSELVQRGQQEQSFHRVRAPWPTPHAVPEEEQKKALLRSVKSTVFRRASIEISARSNSLDLDSSGADSRAAAAAVAGAAGKIRPAVEVAPLPAGAPALSPAA